MLEETINNHKSWTSFSDIEKYLYRNLFLKDYASYVEKHFLKSRQWAGIPDMVDYFIEKWQLSSKWQYYEKARELFKESGYNLTEFEGKLPQLKVPQNAEDISKIINIYQASSTPGTKLDSIQNKKYCEVMRAVSKKSLIKFEKYTPVFPVEFLNDTEVEQYCNDNNGGTNLITHEMLDKSYALPKWISCVTAIKHYEPIIYQLSILTFAICCPIVLWQEYHDSESYSNQFISFCKNVISSDTPKDNAVSEFVDATGNIAELNAGE